MRLALNTAPSVHAAYLFGSFLTSDSPRDIDILLVYELDEIRAARRARDKIASLVDRRCEGTPAHVTMMTCSEIRTSKILSEIHHLSFK